MPPVQIIFPGTSANSIAATQSITATANGFVILNGGLAPVGNLTPSASTPTNSSNVKPVTLAGIARTVNVFATFSATAIIFTVGGYDLNNNFITATFNGASGGAATATSPNTLATSNGVDFHIVSFVQASASVGPISVGTGATGETNWRVMDYYKCPFNVTVGGKLTATTTTYSILDTPDNVQTATAPTTFTNAVINGIATTSLESNYAYPVNAIRGIVTSNSASGGVTFFINQAGT